ncbi:MAG TPA: hypothetical protein VN690_12975 [Terriglobales bacterium]|nr:hypothetical protein [Terriglobales bacterium]
MTHAKAHLGLAVLAAAALLPAQTVRAYRSGGDQVRELGGSVTLSAPVRVEVQARWANLELRGTTGPALRYQLRLRTSASPAASALLAAWPVQISQHLGVVTLVTGAPAFNSVAPIVATLSLEIPRTVRNVVARTTVGNIVADQLWVPLVAITRAGNIRAGALNANLEALSGIGNIEVARAKRVLASTAGSIQVIQADGPAELSTTGGEVSLRFARDSVHVTSAGGGIDIGTAQGPVVAYSEGGSIRLGSAAASAQLHTLGGNIVVDSAHELRAATRSGDIEMRQLLGGVEAQTDSGRIQAVFAARARLAPSELAAQRGSLTVTVPPDLGATVWAEIRAPEGHQIQAEYGGVAPLSGPGLVQARAVLNGGGPALRLLTVGSDILIHKP